MRNYLLTMSGELGYTPSGKPLILQEVLMFRKYFQILGFLSFISLSSGCLNSDAQAAEIVIMKTVNGPKTEFILGIANVKKLAGLKISLTYQNQLLKFIDATKSSETSSFLHVVNDKSPGKLIIVMASAKGISGDNIPLLHMNFRLLQNHDDSLDFKVTGCELMDETLQKIPCNVK